MAMHTPRLLITTEVENDAERSPRPLIPLPANSGRGKPALFRQGEGSSSGIFSEQMLKDNKNHRLQERSLGGDGLVYGQVETRGSSGAVICVHRETEPRKLVMSSRFRVTSFGGPQKTLATPPRSAAHHLFRPGIRAVRVIPGAGSIIIGLIPIGSPFFDVSGHIIQAIGIWQ